jgi:hypothetical protein
MIGNYSRTGKGRENRKSFDFYGPQFEYEDLVKKLNMLRKSKDNGRRFFVKSFDQNQYFQTSDNSGKSPKKNPHFVDHRKFSVNQSVGDVIIEEKIQKQRRNWSSTFDNFEIKLKPVHTKRTPRAVNTFTTQRSLVKVLA